MAAHLLADVESEPDTIVADLATAEPYTFELSDFDLDATVAPAVPSGGRVGHVRSPTRIPRLDRHTVSDGGQAEKEPLMRSGG